MTKKETKKLEKELYAIAAACMVSVESRGHLDTLGYDSGDFIEVPVWGIMEAMKKAYELGKAQA